jgi:hypothetical protein
MTTSMTTDRSTPPVVPDDDASLSPRPLRSNRVIQAALGMVAAQLVLRAWVMYGSWFTGDDFMFISRMVNGGTPPLEAIEPHGGHVMPAGLYLSWLSNEITPYDYNINATMLLIMQAVASLGLVFLLVRMFGARPGILPPLALYLFCMIGTPVAIWWAAAVNAIPLQIALFFGLAAHIEYLRSRAARHLVLTVLAMAFGLVFFEKTILLLGVLGIVSVSYFASGDLRTRVVTMWRTYRAACLTYVVLGVAYLAGYAKLALNFSPSKAGSNDLGEVISNMVFQTYVPSMVGGMLRWSTLGGFSLPRPTDLMVLASVVAVGLVLREIHLRRTGSLRAWFLPGFVLLCDVLLVLAGRVSFVGLLISLDPRYQGELPAVTAIALACATMRIRGSVEGPEVRPDPAPAAQPEQPEPPDPADARADGAAATESRRLLDHPQRVAMLTVAFVLLSLVSSYQYAHRWMNNLDGKDYYANLTADLQEAKEPVPLIDHAVPGYILWELVYPANLLSRVLVPYAHETEYHRIATDDLNMIDSHGNIEPLVISPVRTNVPGPREGCGYAVRTKPVRVPLGGPVAYGGWWVRVGYLSSGQSPVVIKAGVASYSTVVRPGVHALYFEGGPDFESIEISGLSPGVTLCTDDVTVGRPHPVTEPQEPAA